MQLTKTDLIEIKKTKSLAMYNDTERGGLQIYLDTGDGGHDSMFVPASKVFQLQRGIVSFLQRFYRKKK